MQTDGRCFRCSDVVLQRKKAHDQWLWKPFLPVIVKRYLFEWAHAFQSLPPRWEKPMKDMNRYEKGWMHFEHRGMAAPNTNRFFRRDVVILCGNESLWINSGTGAHEAQFSSEFLVSSKARYRISRLSATVCSTAIRFWSFLMDHHWSLVKPFWTFFDFFFEVWRMTRYRTVASGWRRAGTSSWMVLNKNCDRWNPVTKRLWCGSTWRTSDCSAQFGIQTRWQDLIAGSFFQKISLHVYASLEAESWCFKMFQNVNPHCQESSKALRSFVGFEMFRDFPPILHCPILSRINSRVTSRVIFFRTKAFASQRMNSLGSGQSS